MIITPDIFTTKTVEKAFHFDNRMPIQNVKIVTLYCPTGIWLQVKCFCFSRPSVGKSSTTSDRQNNFLNMLILTFRKVSLTFINCNFRIHMGVLRIRSLYKWARNFSRSLAPFFFRFTITEAKKNLISVCGAGQLFSESLGRNYFQTAVQYLSNSEEIINPQR